MSAIDQPGLPTELKAGPSGVTEVQSHVVARFLVTFVNVFYFVVALPYGLYHGGLSTPESRWEFAVTALVILSALLLVRRSHVRLAPGRVSVRRVSGRWRTLRADEVVLRTSWATRTLCTAVCGFLVAQIPLRLYGTLTDLPAYAGSAQQTPVSGSVSSWLVLLMWTLVGVSGIATVWRTELRLAPGHLAWRLPLLRRWTVVRRSEVRRFHVERHRLPALRLFRSLTVHLVTESPGGERRLTVCTSSSRMRPLLAHLQGWARDDPHLIDEGTTSIGDRVDDGADVVVLRTPWVQRLFITSACGFVVAAGPIWFYEKIFHPERAEYASGTVPPWLGWPIYVLLAVACAWGIAAAWRTEVCLGQDWVAVRWPLLVRWRVIQREQLTSIRLKQHGAPAPIGPLRSLSVRLTADTPNGPRRIYVNSSVTHVGPLLARLQSWARDNPDLLDGDLTRRVLLDQGDVAT